MIKKSVEHESYIYATPKKKNPVQAFNFLLRHNKKWVNYLDDYKLEIIIQPKVDGIFIATMYDNGQLVDCITKGNRQLGYSLLSIIPNIKGLPKNIKPKEKITVISELTISNEELKNNDNLKFIDNIDPRKVFSSIFLNKIKFKYVPTFTAINFDILDKNNIILNFKEVESFLLDNSFNTIPYIKHTIDFKDKKSIEIFRNPIDNILNKYFSNFVNNYRIDGLMYKVYFLKNYKHIYRKGNTHNWLVAYKFNRYERVTKIKEIVWGITKKGHIVPKANIDIFETDRGFIKHIRFNSYNNLKSKNIKIGNKVRIASINGTVFNIEEVLEPDKDDILIDWKAPTQCISCLEPVENNGIKIICYNPSCIAVLVEKIFIFLSNFFVERFGNGNIIMRSNIYNLINIGYIKKYVDIFNIAENSDYIYKIFKIKKEKLNKLIEIINLSKNRDLFFYLKALSIDGIGVSDLYNIKKLIKRKKIRTIQEFANIKYSEFENAGLHKKNINNIYIYFSSEINKKLIEGLDEYIKNEY